MQPHAPISPEKNELLDTLQRDSFTYFVHKTNPGRKRLFSGSFGGIEKTNQQKKTKVIKIKSTLISVIIAVTQSTWTRPTQMVLAILVAVLGVTGCKPHH